MAGFAGAVGAFFVIALGLGAALPRVGIEDPARVQVILKVVMMAAAAAFWGVLRRPWKEMGWGRGVWPRGTWKVVLLGCLPMMAASVVMVMTGFRHPLASKLSVVELVFEVWVLSSVAEEIFVRGAMQGWCELGMGEHEKRGVFAAPVVMSAAAFGSMHMPLMWKGAGVVGGGVIVAATLLVGWACAVVRARTGSLWGAIGLHIAANVAAVPGGILGVVLYRVVFGTMPELGS